MAFLTEQAKKRALRKRVIRGDAAVTCCELAHQSARGRIMGVISGLLDRLANPPSGHSLALQVAPGIGVSVITIEETAALARPVTGALIILAGADLLIDLASQTATYDTLAIVATAVGELFKEQPSCADCVLDRALSQGARRQRQRVKILRRL